MERSMDRPMDWFVLPRWRLCEWDLRDRGLLIGAGTATTVFWVTGKFVRLNDQTRMDIGIAIRNGTSR